VCCIITDILCSDFGEDEWCGLIGCDTVWFGRWVDIVLEEYIALVFKAQTNPEGRGWYQLFERTGRLRVKGTGA
jgi:hypothetical protein